MTNQTNNKNSIDEIKKSIDRLSIIELVKSGATRDQIRDIIGPISNNYLATVRKAIKNKQKDEE